MVATIGHPFIVLEHPIVVFRRWRLFIELRLPLPPELTADEEQALVVDLSLTYRASRPVGRVWYKHDADLGRHWKPTV
jgi:hypothetical protein